MLRVPLLNIRYVFLILIFCYPAIASANTIEKIKVAVNKNTPQLYSNILRQQPTTTIKVTDLKGQRLTPAVIQILIIKQALHYGGLTIDFEFVVAPNKKRAAALLTGGKVVISNFIGFLKSQPEAAHISSPVIESKALLKGIYGLATNTALMKVKSIDDLKLLKGVLVSSWLSDIATLKSHGLTQIELTPNYQTLFTRITYRDTDYTLLDFPYWKNSDNQPLVRHLNENKLYAVPNVAIAIEGSRHFFISKKHPDGERVYQALEKGLKIMKEQGTIKKYYQQINMFNNGLTGFKVLNE